ncbi:MAG: cupin domain-containing protein [Betaproteobacteria bacterium]|nr:cupin domain-containing protein [Betaproteobacteria bacterium]
MKQLSDVTQKFTVSRSTGESDFKLNGLRPYAKYRDFGFAQATEGMVHAHVIQLIGPCTDEVRKRHMHGVHLQLVYCLQGWIKIEHEGQGEMIMKAGDAWLMPPNIKHTVLDYSDDCRNLEITVPAEYSTIDC